MRFVPCLLWFVCACSSTATPTRSTEAPGLSTSGGQGSFTKDDAGNSGDGGIGGTADGGTAGAEDGSALADGVLMADGGQAGGADDANSTPLDVALVTDANGAVSDANGGGASDTGSTCKEGDQGCQANNIVQCTKGKWLGVQPCAPSTLCTLTTTSTGAIAASCQVQTCGNGVCDGGETNASCAKDCPAPNPCGNGVCDAGETNASCPKDCPPPKVTSGCGSGTDPQFLNAAQTSSGQVQNAYWSIVYKCVTANLGTQGEVCTAKVTSCIQGQPSPVGVKPSDACANCFSTLSCCMAQKCLAECAFDPGSLGCWACANNAGCLPAWSACIAAKP